MSSISPTVAALIGWTPPKTDPASKWLAVESNMEKALAPFLREQSERLDLGTLRVESLGGEKVNFVVDGYGSDHESEHLFNTTVRGQLNVLTGKVTRVA